MELKNNNFIFALSCVPFVAGLTTSIYFCVAKNNEADKQFDDFKNSEIFQELKAEELEDLSKLEITYNEAKEKHEAGEISAKDFLTTERQFYDKKIYIESEQFVYNGMKQAGVYEDYEKTRSQAINIGAAAIPASVIVGVAVAGLGFALTDDCPDICWDGHKGR